MSITHVPVVGTFHYRDVAETPAANARVVFIARSPAIVDGQVVTLPKKLTITLTDAGALPVGFTLPTLDGGVYYIVRESFSGGRDDYTIQVLPTDALIDLATAPPVVPVEPMVSYLTPADIGVRVASQAQSADHETRIDALETGGGGGGAVDSVNGQTGVVVLGAADVGADPSGTAAAAVTAHEASSDPHPQYATPVEAAAAAPVQSVAGKVGAVTITSADVSGLSAVATTGAYADLGGKPTIPAAQVNSDWLAGSGLAQILNKPTLGDLAQADRNSIVGPVKITQSGSPAEAALSLQASATDQIALAYYDSSGILQCKETVYNGITIRQLYCNETWYMGDAFLNINSPNAGGLAVQGRFSIKPNNWSPYAFNIGNTAYATNYYPLTTIYGANMWVFAWNGSNGSALYSNCVYGLQQKSAVAGDAKWFLAYATGVGEHKLEIDLPTGEIKAFGPFKPVQYVVASLPAGTEGQQVYASNGRKFGEGAGAGTGVPVYFSAGKWRVYRDDSEVVA